MRVNYKYIKALVETFTVEEVLLSRFLVLIHIQELKLRTLIATDDKTRWKRIAHLSGKSEVTVRNKAKEWGLTK